MNFTFVAIIMVVALMGLFVLAFALVGVLHSHKWTGGKQGNVQSRHCPLRMGLLVILLSLPSFTTVTALPQDVVRISWAKTPTPSASIAYRQPMAGMFVVPV